MNDTTNNQENYILLNLLNLGAKTDIGDNFDWEGLVQKAIQKNVASIIYYQIAKSDISDRIPKEHLMQLRKAYLNNLGKNMRLYKELSVILEAMRNKEIPIIVLKGMALAETVYKNIALRPMVDIDLLIKSSDVKVFDLVMQEMGWSNQSCLNKTGLKEDCYKHIDYTKNKILIEVHIKISEIPQLDPWEKAIKTKIANMDTFILGIEDFLMHLCMHLEEHLRIDRMANLIWYLDIIEFLNIYQSKINWNYIILTAKQNSISYSLYKIFNTINEDFNGNIPIDVLDQLDSAKGKVNLIANIIQYFRFLLADFFGPPSLPMHKRAYIGFRNIFPCKDYMIYYYSYRNPKIFYLYYFVHIILSAKRLLSRLFHLPHYIKSIMSDV